MAIYNHDLNTGDRDIEEETTEWVDKHNFVLISAYCFIARP